MNKELQDLAWSLLPKAFKEEVKYEYRRVATKVIKSNYDLGFMNAHEGMYGHHNLTSDAEGEGEEMLIVNRSQLMDAFNSAKIIGSSKMSSKMLAEAANMCINTFKDLFGSKCLPDDTNDDTKDDTKELNVDSLEPKPAEPKYHKGEKVYYNGYVYEIEGYVGKNRYALKGLNFDLDEDMIESYTKPEENIAENRNLPQDCDKQSYTGICDKLIKDGFRNHNRMHIAAMCMQGILSNESLMKQYEATAALEPYEKLIDVVACNALRYADALMNKAGE